MTLIHPESIQLHLLSFVQRAEIFINHFWKFAMKKIAENNICMYVYDWRVSFNFLKKQYGLHLGFTDEEAEAEKCAVSLGLTA